MTDRDLAKVPKLRVHDHPVGHTPLTPGHEAIWHPLDSLVGHFIITNPSEVDIESATVHLQGRGTLDDIVLHTFNADDF